RDHFFFFGIPFTPLPMDINPNAEPLFVTQSSVGDFCRDPTILLFFLILDENFGIRPPPVAIDNAKFVPNVWMRLEQQRLKNALVGFDLPLKFGVLLWPHTRLLRIRHNVIKIDLIPIRPQDGSSKSPFLPAIGQFFLHAVASSEFPTATAANLVLCVAASLRSAGSSSPSITAATSVSISLKRLLILIANAPRFFQVLSWAFFSCTSRSTMSCASRPASLNFFPYASEVTSL